jgi:hypothetical protein
MHPDVLQFIRFLQEVDQQDKTQLNLIIAKIGALQSSYLYCMKENKQYYSEQLQQYSDLFAHVYFGNALREFSDCLNDIYIDNDW